VGYDGNISKIIFAHLFPFEGISSSEIP